MTDTLEIPQDLTDFITTCIGVKEGQVRGWKAGETDTDDVTPAVRILCTDPHMLAVTVVAPQINRDMGLQAARFLTGALQPDWVTMMADAHVTRATINPVTGKPWEPGEMQNLCDNEGACSTGLLTDCLTFTTIWRDDARRRMDNRMYVVNKELGTVEWLTDPEERVFDTAANDKGNLSGFITDSMVEAFTAPEFTALRTIGSDILGLPPTELQHHSFMGIGGALSEAGFMVMVNTDNPLILERIG